MLPIYLTVPNAIEVPNTFVETRETRAGYPQARRADGTGPGLTDGPQDSARPSR